MGENSLGGREPKDEEGSELRGGKEKKPEKRSEERREGKEIGKGGEREGEEKKGF